MSVEAPTCMLVGASSVGIDKTLADAPSGSITREAAIANASMVRTSRIGVYLPAFCGNKTTILHIAMESLILLKHL
jgi:hypothetical protein